MQLILNVRKSSKRESFQFRLTSQTIVFVENSVKIHKNMVIRRPDVPNMTENIYILVDLFAVPAEY